MIERRYYLNKKITLDDLSKSIDRYWSDLQRDDSDVTRRARAANLDIAELRKLKKQESLSLKSEGAGLDPASIAILVALGVKIVGDLWEKVLLPLIRQDKGGDSIKSADSPKSS